MNWRANNTIIPRTDIRQDEPMSTKPYTTASACADAVTLAQQAIGMAINLAEQAKLPILGRLNDIASDLRDASDIAESQHRDSQRALSSTGPKDL
jgi:hypothetical protein